LKKAEINVKIGIVGPSSLVKVANLIGVPTKLYEKFVINVGKIIAKKKLEIILCPEKGSIPYICATAYKKRHGLRVVGVIPNSLKNDEKAKLSLDLCDTIIVAPNWFLQPLYLVRESDALVVLGLGRGTMIEICYAGLHHWKPIILFSNLLSKPLHQELFIQNLHYLNTLNEFSSFIDRLVDRKFRNSLSSVHT
jgi:predicted Rossmann-fold nucleotide-binding protein